MNNSNILSLLIFNEIHFRTSENNSAEIRIEDKDERLVLYFLPKNGKKKRGILRSIKLTVCAPDGEGFILSTLHYRLKTKFKLLINQMKTQYIWTLSNVVCCSVSISLFEMCPCFYLFAFLF